MPVVYVRSLSETEISDGKISGKKVVVQCGSKVDILPVELRQPDPEYGHQFNNLNHKKQLDTLGNGPFTVEAIIQENSGVWLTVKRGQKILSRYPAKDFKIAGS